MGRINAALIDSSAEQFHSSIEALNYYKPKVLYVSPLIRAAQSADIICGEYHFDQVETNGLLIERSFAEFEGMKKTSENRVLMEKSLTVESKEAILLRLSQFLKQTSLDDIIAIISHSNVYKIFQELDKVSVLIGKEELKCSEFSLVEIR